MAVGSQVTKPPRRRPVRWTAARPEGEANALPVLEPELLANPKVVATLVTGEKTFDSMRYWSIFDDNEGVTLIARSGNTASASRCIRTSVFQNCTPSLRRGTEACVRLTSRRYLPSRSASCGDNAATNLALYRESSSLVVGIGGEGGDGPGESRRVLRYHQKPHNATVGERKSGATWFEATSLSEVLNSGWRLVSKDRLKGDAKGCVETMTSHPLKLCKFDSQFSIAPIGKELLLYTRANVNASGGGRYVQVTRINRENDISFSSFRLLRFLRGPPFFYDEENAGFHDAYNFLVNRNPALPDSLLALFPLVLARTDAYLCLAVSRDGITFSPPRPILRTETFGREGRPFDLPVDGFIVRSGLVFLYVHANVMGIVARDGYPPHIARFSMPLEMLRRFSFRELAKLDK